MNNTKWIYKDNKIPNELESLNLDRDILNILINRGIDSKEKIYSFLNSGVDTLVDPFQMAQMEKAVNRILFAIENKEDIWIYGDYDVDGITSTSITYLALKELGANISYYIPLRDEGYGLNNEALSYIKEKGAKVVITVDCGISSINEALHAKELGLDLIITDHHEITGKLPDAYSIINPKREDQLYKFKYLAGVGTVYMLLTGIYMKLNREKELYRYLDIVAIGTIADIVPLLEQNRILVKEGLERLKNTDNIGLKILLPLIFENYHDREYNSYDIGFIIAPIFNAAGRLEDAKMAVELLTTPSSTTAKLLAEKLITKNNERKDIQRDILEKVEADIEERKLYNMPVIVSYGKDFHHGVIGIVASKIVDKYYKPTIILEIKENEGIAVASCRSIEGFNILEGLNNMKDLFIKYGGHAGAAGLSISIENIPKFEKEINEYANNLIDKEDLLKPIKIDKDIIFNKISFDFFQKVEKLKPFGFGNPNPLFAIRGVSLENIRLIGKDKSHLMLDIVEENLKIKNCVWFSNGHNFNNLKSFVNADVAFKLKAELYKDKFYTKVYIEDIIESKYEKNPYREYFDIYNTEFPIETIVYSRNPLELSDKAELIINADSAYIKSSGRIIAFIDDKLSYRLRTLKEEYLHNFKLKISKIEKTSSNYQIYIEIDKEYKFSTLSFKDGDIFKDIKEYLLGPFPYNSLQRNVLNSFFREDQNTHIINGKNRGIKTLYATLALFYKLKDKSLLLVTQDLEDDFLNKILEIDTSYKEGYDIYIFHNQLPPSTFKGKSLVYTDKELKLDNYNTIDGSIELPKNIKIIKESELNLYNNKIYSEKIPLKVRLDIYNKLDKIEEIYATKDILKLI